MLFAFLLRSVYVFILGHEIKYKSDNLKKDPKLKAAVVDRHGVKTTKK